MNMHGTAFFPPNFPAEKCHVVHYTSAYFTATSAELSCEFYITFFFSSLDQSQWSFMVLNFADVTIRENAVVSWDVRGVSSP
jgi:hypothetical protein